MRARHQPLGADNGIGVAAMLAVLESDDIAHPPLEALFTVNEEAGMDGARHLAEDLLTGRFLLNLDTEDWGEFCIGCAGGEDVILRRQCEREPARPPEHHAWRLTVRGLCGGHFGWTSTATAPTPPACWRGCCRTGWALWPARRPTGWRRAAQCDSARSRRHAGRAGKQAGALQHLAGLAKRVAATPAGMGPRPDRHPLARRS